MTPSTEQYCILLRDYADAGDGPRFTGAEAADEATSNRLFDHDPIRLDGPMQFRMDMFDLRRASNMPGEIGDFIISGPVVLVSQPVRDVIAAFQNPNFELYPARLDTIDGGCVEPLYYLHMMRHLELWDRQRSEYLMPFDADEDLGASLTRIVLDDALVAQIPEVERMVIGLDRLDELPILFHEKLVEALQQRNLTNGARLFRLSEYTLGQELL